jgi:dipeptidyl-peptidase-4
MAWRDPKSFFESLERHQGLSRSCQPVFQWISADCVSWAVEVAGVRRHFQWTTDHGLSAVQAQDPVRQPPADERRQPRTYLREIYLVPDVPALEAVSPDRAWLASVRNGDIWLRSADTDEKRRLTTGGSADMAWDIDGRGVDVWSPDGTCLFATRVDRRGVDTAVRPRFDGGQVTVDHPRQQRAGATLDLVQPALVPVDGRGPLNLDLGDMRDHFVRLLGWLPDAVVFARFSRRLDVVEVFEADTRSGRPRRIFEERSATFLRNCGVIWFEPVGFTVVDDQRFLWTSQREGHNHLYLVQRGDGAMRRLTEGAFMTGRVLRVDQDTVWLTGSEDGDRPYDVHLYRVSLDQPGLIRLTSEPGEHVLTLSPDGHRFVDTVSAPDRPPVSTLRTADGRAIQLLHDAAQVGQVPAGRRMPRPFQVMAADGSTPLHGVLLLPPATDEGRRHPVVHWVYGGPQSVETNHGFAPRPGKSDAFLHALADAGYVVVVLDARGTPGRSKAFQDAVFRDWGDHVIADQIGALQQLLERHPFMDPDRIVAAGRSWGGYFSLRLLAEAPDLYRACSCVVPGFDPYGGLIYEPYLGLPQDDASPYRAAEPWGLAARIRGRVQLIGGTLDSSTLWDIHRMATALIDAEVPHQCLIVPEQEHSFQGVADRYHHRAMLDFFDACVQ